MLVPCVDDYASHVSKQCAALALRRCLDAAGRPTPVPCAEVEDLALELLSVNVLPALLECAVLTPVSLTLLSAD